MFSNVQATLAGKLLSRELMSPARDQLALCTLPVYISSPVVAIIPISCSSRVSSIYVRLFDFDPRADCRRAAVGMTLRAQDCRDICCGGYYRGRTQRTVREACGVDTAKYGLLHKVEWANIHNAWLAVKINQEVKSKVDAVARAHGTKKRYISRVLADPESLRE